MCYATTAPIKGQPMFARATAPGGSYQVITLIGNDQGEVHLDKRRTVLRPDDHCYEGVEFATRKELRISFLDHQGKKEVRMRYPRGLSLPYQIWSQAGRFWLVAKNDQGIWAPIREITGGDVPAEILGYFKMRCADRAVHRTCCRV